MESAIQDEAVTESAQTSPLRAARKTRFDNLILKLNKLLSIFCMVSIFVDPLFFLTVHVNMENNCFSINETMAKALVVIRSITDCVYLLNILLQFKLPYVSLRSRIVDRPIKTALKYFKDYIFSLCVVLPLPQILIIFILPNSSMSVEEHYDAKKLLFLLMLVQYILRLFRFLPRVIGQFPTRFIFQSAWATFIMNILFFLLFSHIVGCCWYLFALERVERCLIDACHLADLSMCKTSIDCNSNWAGKFAAWRGDQGATNCLNVTSGAFSYGIYVNAIRLTIETNVINKYLYSLFWGFQQISTLTRYLYLSSNQFVWEAIFRMTIIGLGLSLFTLLIANLLNFLQGLEQRSLEMELRSRDVEE